MLNASFVACRLALWFSLSGLILILDQISKFWIIGTIHPSQVIALSSYLNLVQVHNFGAAFSFLSDASGWQRWFFVVSSLAISAYLVLMLVKHIREWRLPLAASLVLGGAFGNVTDRLVFGAVIDFIDVHIAAYHWPAFNVADSAISLGVALLLWDQFNRDQKKI